MFGLTWNLGADFRISKNFSLGFCTGAHLGALNQYNYDDGLHSKIIHPDKDYLESISRIDLSAGLRWSM